MKILCSSIHFCVYVCVSRSAWEHGGKPWKVQWEGNNDASESIEHLLFVPYLETFYFVLKMAELISIPLEIKVMAKIKGLELHLTFSWISYSIIYTALCIVVNLSSCS